MCWRWIVSELYDTDLCTRSKIQDDAVTLNPNSDVRPPQLSTLDIYVLCYFLLKLNVPLKIFDGYATLACIQTHVVHFVGNFKCCLFDEGSVHYF